MRKIIFLIFIIGLLVLGVSKLSFANMCGISSGPKGHQHEQASGAQAKPAQAVNAGNKVCPVLGEKIDETNKVTYEHEGKVYSFCCASCIDAFKENPEKYIKKVGEELQTQESAHQGHGH